MTGGEVDSICICAGRDERDDESDGNVTFGSDWRAAEEGAADEPVSSGRDEIDEVDDQKFFGCDPGRSEDEDVLSLCRCPSRCCSASHG